MEIEQDIPVTILFFAQAKELAGVKEATVQLPRKISYGKLLLYLTQRFNLESIKNNILLAKNEEVCNEDIDVEIKEKDKIAIIPPLSGG